MNTKKPLSKHPHRFNGQNVYQNNSTLGFVYINSFYVGHNSKLEEYDKYGDHLGSKKPNGDDIPNSKDINKKTALPSLDSL